MILTLYRYQLLNVVRGLTYLHRHNLVHGNLTEVSIDLPVPKSGGLTAPQCNILVDSDGIARISEYDLRIILCDGASPESTLTNVRWMAPEVLSTKYKCIPSVDGGKASDVYSFAMVMFKVCLSRRHSPHSSLSQHLTPRP